MSDNVTARKLPVWYKLAYGSGDIGRASFNTLRMLFYAIFLTDVVGLDRDRQHRIRRSLERRMRRAERKAQRG